MKILHTKPSTTNIYNSPQPNYSILYIILIILMRPQSAQHSKTVLFNQLSGQYFTLSEQGK